jgi:hypothetical protein
MQKYIKNITMKPYMNLKGKGRWKYFWGDKTKSKFKRIFSKSIRQLSKKLTKT